MLKSPKVKKNYRLSQTLIDNMIKVAELEHRTETGLIEHVMSMYCNNKLTPVKSLGQKKPN